MKKFTKKDFLIFSGCIILSIFAISYNQQIQAQNQVYFPRPLSDDDIKKYSNPDPHAIVIYPIFTQSAYKAGGFYDYFNGTCPSCLNTSLDLGVNATYPEGVGAFQYLQQLHYPFITDIDVDRDPSILDKYDKIILLHNEYMTAGEFDAIAAHKNVIYLYPNSMYAEINVDYKKYTITLVRGHGYPQKNIANGFNYVTSSQHEYDLNCKNYKWEERPNGIQPTCWPEFLIKADRNLLQIIKDYPNKVPPLIIPAKIIVDTTKIGQCDYYGNCNPKP